MNSRTRSLVGALLAAALLAPGPSAFGLTAQQERMKECNADATQKGLKGADRSAFMETCLSGKSHDQHAKMTPQQEKMKNCDHEAAAKNLKGAERKQFMSTCLSSGGQGSH